MSKNFAFSTVATAPSPATSGTSLVVAAGEGARFYPGQAFVAPAGVTSTPTNSEVVTITAVATDTLTIVRAQESSAARTVVVGDPIYQGISADMWDRRIPGGPIVAVPGTGRPIGMPSLSNGTFAPNTSFHAACPVVFDRSFTADRFAIEVTVAATSGSVCRAGLYADSGTMLPSNLLVEWTSATQIDTATAGVKQLTISTAFQAYTRYWVLLKFEGGAPTVRSLSSPLWRAMPFSIDEALNYAAGTRYGAEANLPSPGALPSTWPGINYGGGTLAAFAFRVA